MDRKSRSLASLVMTSQQQVPRFARDDKQTGRRARDDKSDIVAEGTKSRCLAALVMTNVRLHRAFAVLVVTNLMRNRVFAGSS